MLYKADYGGQEGRLLNKITGEQMKKFGISTSSIRFFSGRTRGRLEKSPGVVYYEERAAQKKKGKWAFYKHEFQLEDVNFHLCSYQDSLFQGWKFVYIHFE
jgi:hypothetical protein